MPSVRSMANSWEYVPLLELAQCGKRARANERPTIANYDINRRAVLTTSSALGR